MLDENSPMQQQGCVAVSICGASTNAECRVQLARSDADQRVRSLPWVRHFKHSNDAIKIRQQNQLTKESCNFSDVLLVQNHRHRR